jgi:glycosyltransferase involved in cell wall biosynthesis
MKVLYICTDGGVPILGRKGASVHVRELVKAFSAAGNRVVVAAQILNKSPWETPATIVAHVIQIRPSASALSAIQSFKEFNASIRAENSFPSELRRILYNRELAEDLRRRFENDKPDFIYERAALFSTGGIVLARQLGVPHVLELNAPLALEQATYRGTGLGELAGKTERWALTNTDALITVSAKLKEHAVALGTDKRKVHVVPNGVNTEVFMPGPRDEGLKRQLGLNGGPVLGFVGGLRPWHGVEMLPPLLKRLRQRCPDVQLVIAGDGQLRESLLSDFERLGLSSQVVFTGLLQHEEIPGVIRQFDAALAPYPDTNHDFYFSPLKLFEYMACGVPVVAARIGQISEVVTNGKTGLLYSPGKLSELVANCERLFGDAGLRNKIGKAGATLVHKKYTWAANAARVIEIVQSITERRGLSRGATK